VPNFTAGTSFTDGVTNDVTAAKLNALVADAVPTSSLALASTTGTISNFTASTANITLGTIPTLTAGTTTSTAANITSGTIQTLTSSTATITGGTFSGSINSTTGTIGNLSTTLAGDFTISQGTATLSTTGATAATYGTTSDIPRITVDAKGRITAASTVTNPVGFRNRIINGDMRIDQRNDGASVTPANAQYTLDRWRAYLSQASKYSVQQNAGSVTPPTGFINYLGVTSLSVYSVGASEFFSIQQFIEGFNVADLGWGTAQAKTVCLSFQVYSSLTGTFGGVLQNDAQNRSYPFTYSIPTANTWTTISITVAGDTGGTWLTNSGRGIAVWFGLGVGSTLSGTAGAWAGASYYSATSAVSVVGTSGATFYITGVQLESGTTATDFERRPYGTELALCQRYYESGGGANNSLWYGYAVSGINYYYGVSFIVTKRITPTVYNITNIATNGFPVTASSVGVITSVGMQLGRACSSTTNGAYFLDRWDASAEL
jgi:hypothetical protein